MDLTLAGAKRGRTVVLAYLVAAIALLVPNASSAGALYVAEAAVTPNNGVSVAGSAASTSDASTSYYNPAGMANMDGSHFLLGGGLGVISTRFSTDSGTSPSLDAGGNGGQAGGLVPLFAGYFVYDPSSHFEGDWAKRVRLGVSSVTVAALLDYDGGWAGRYLSEEIKVVAPSINPVAAFQITDWLSFGGGLILEYMKLDMKIALPNPTIPPGGTPPPDGELDISLHDFAVGGSLGLHFVPMEELQIGLVWMSARKHDLSGDSDFTNLIPPVNSVLTGSNVGLQFDLAQTITASVQYDLNQEVRLLASVGWEDWSVMDYNIIENDSPQDITIPRVLRDTWNISAGVEWRAAEKWLLQTGLRYDSSPYSSRGNRLPDMPFDRQIHASVGVVHDWSEKASLSAALSYVNLGDAPINVTTGPGTLSGDYSTNEAWFLTLTVNLH